MAPKDENELRHMLLTAIKQDGPVSIRYPRGKGVGAALEAPMHELPLGKGEILRQGEDVSIIAIGNTVYPSLEAAELLEKEGIAAAVVNARYVKPLDNELILNQAEKSGKILTVEEHVRAGGFGSAVLELLAQQDLRVEVYNLAVPDEFIQQGDTVIMRKEYKLDGPGIADTVRKRFFSSEKGLKNG